MERSSVAQLGPNLRFVGQISRPQLIFPIPTPLFNYWIYSTARDEDNKDITFTSTTSTKKVLQRIKYITARKRKNMAALELSCITYSKVLIKYAYSVQGPKARLVSANMSPVHETIN